MIEIHILLILISLHFISDFVFQSDYVARNKSKSNYVLLQHVIIYGALFIFIGWLYAFVNAVLHFIVDWNTSRATSYLWEKHKTHWFFVVIGFDQALHMSCLLLTYYWMIK